MRGAKRPKHAHPMRQVKAVHHPAYRAMIRRLVDARKKCRLTQASVASLFGVHHQWVSKIENCDVSIDVISLIRLCRVYRIRSADLVGWMEKKLPPAAASFFAITRFLSGTFVRAHPSQRQTRSFCRSRLVQIVNYPMVAILGSHLV